MAKKDKQELQATEELIYSTDDQRLAVQQEKAGNPVVSIVRVDRGTKKYTFQLPVNRPLPVVEETPVELEANQTSDTSVKEAEQAKGNALVSITGKGNKKIYTFARAIG